MPNMVDCKLEIVGAQEEVESLLRFVEGSNEAFDFNKILPYDKPEGELSEEENSFPDPPDEWCTEHWGTKWNACEPTLVKKEDWGDGELFAYIKFSTAWTPPLPVIDALAKLFARLKITLFYVEECYTFSGSDYWANGERKG
jgi:hypothetical protein